MIKKLKDTLLTKIRKFILNILTLTDPRVSTGNIVGVNSEKCISPDNEDVKLAKIICESYDYMLRKSETVEKVYKTGEFWKEVIHRIKWDFYKSIKTGDIDSSSFVLANFFRTSAIMGLWEGGTWRGAGYPPLTKSLKRKLNFISGTLRNYDLWRLVANQPLEVVDLPDVGNPFGYKLEDSIVSTAQFKLHYHSLQTFNLSKNVRENPVVLEIGGGFGGIAYYLFKMGFNGTYLGFAIPDTLILSMYFLKKALPDKKILTYQNQEIITMDDIDNYDIILMPNYMLKNIPDLCTDIVINTRSFSEMPLETIKEYMVQIDRVCRKYIYHDNANYKSHKYETPADEFPIPSSFRLLTKVKSVCRYQEVPNLETYTAA